MKRARFLQKSWRKYLSRVSQFQQITRGWIEGIATVKKVACQNSQGNTETVSEFIISVS